MDGEPEHFASGQVTIEATIEHCRFSWPLSGDDLESQCSSRLALSNLPKELHKQLDTSSISWDKCDVTAVPKWQGMKFRARGTFVVPLAEGIRKEAGNTELDTLPDALASALEGDGNSLGFNHPVVEDVGPRVTAAWEGNAIRVSVDVPSTRRAWADPLPPLRKAITSRCDLSGVPDDLRKALAVKGDSVRWDGIYVTDESDENGIGYSATATVTISLARALDEDDEDTLRGSLDDNYGSLLAELPGAEYECDDGGSVSVEVEQEFEEPEPEEEEDEEEDWDGEIDEEEEDDLEDDLEDDQEDKKDED